MTRLGYIKDVDWIENLIQVPTDEKVIERWRNLKKFVAKRCNLHVFKPKPRLD